MFDSRSAVAGLAVMSGVTASLGSSTSAAAAPAPAPAVHETQYCVVQALPVDAVRRGEQSPVACASTPEAATAELDRRTRGSSFAAASAFVAAADLVLAIMYDSPNGPTSGWDEWWVRGDCSLAGNVRADWNDRISSVQLGACSSVKLYKGYNLSDASTLVKGSGALGLQPDFNDQTSSMKFGA
jgi:hypothetical protein